MYVSQNLIQEKLQGYVTDSRVMVQCSLLTHRQTGTVTRPRCMHKVCARHWKIQINDSVSSLHSIFYSEVKMYMLGTHPTVPNCVHFCCDLFALFYPYCKKLNESIGTFSPLYKYWNIQDAVVILYSAVSRNSIHFSHDKKVFERWTVKESIISQGQVLCFRDMNPTTSLIIVSIWFFILLFVKGAISCHWIGDLLISSNYTKNRSPACILFPGII